MLPVLASFQGEKALAFEVRLILVASASLPSAELAGEAAGLLSSSVTNLWMPNVIPSKNNNIQGIKNP